MHTPTPLILIASDPDPIHAAAGCKVSVTHRAGRYPMVNVKRRGKSTTTPMARWLLGLYRGRALRRGEEAMHEICDNSRCIAIEHLKVGTHAENERHKWAVGRGVVPPRYDARGEQNGNAKLTAKQVAAIRRAARRVSQRALAQRYHVTKQAISLVVLGRTWRHLAAARVGGMHGEAHPPSSQPAGAPHDARAQPARGDRGDRANALVWT